MVKSPSLARLQARLEAIPRRVKEAVKPALEKSGKELADGMRALAPEDEGDLKRSVTYTMGGQQTPPYSQPGGSKTVPENAVVVTVGNTDVRYPHLVEYGTTKAQAQPYFWPTVRAKRKKITNRINRAIRKAVREGGK